MLTAARCAELALAQNAQAFIAEAKAAAARARAGEAASTRFPQAKATAGYRYMSDWKPTWNLATRNLVGGVGQLLGREGHQ